LIIRLRQLLTITAESLLEIVALLESLVTLVGASVVLSRFTCCQPVGYFGQFKRLFYRGVAHRLKGPLLQVGENRTHDDHLGPGKLAALLPLVSKN